MNLQIESANIKKTLANWMMLCYYWKIIYESKAMKETLAFGT